MHPFVPIPGQETLVAAIQKNARAILGEDIKPHGVPLYTDARHYSAAGVPTAQIFLARRARGWTLDLRDITRCPYYI